METMIFSNKFQAIDSKGNSQAFCLKISEVENSLVEKNQKILGNKLEH